MIISQLRYVRTPYSITVVLCVFTIVLYNTYDNMSTSYNYYISMCSPPWLSG